VFSRARTVCYTGNGDHEGPVRRVQHVACKFPSRNRTREPAWGNANLFVPSRRTNGCTMGVGRLLSTNTIAPTPSWPAYPACGDRSSVEREESTVGDWVWCVAWPVGWFGAGDLHGTKRNLEVGRKGSRRRQMAIPSQNLPSCREEWRRGAPERARPGHESLY